MKNSRYSARVISEHKAENLVVLVAIRNDAGHRGRSLEFHLGRSLKCVA